MMCTCSNFLKPQFVVSTDFPLETSLCDHQKNSSGALRGPPSIEKRISSNMQCYLCHHPVSNAHSSCARY